jgi:Holliday junction resolvase-like predicted endonuclease
MRRNGCRVLARNLRLPVGEIDLLCHEKQSGTIVIVEVKARAYTPDSNRSIDPTASITSKKRAKLLLLAKAIKRMPRFAQSPIRIDVVSVRFEPGKRRPQIRHYPGCVSDS